MAVKAAYSGHVREKTQCSAHAIRDFNAGRIAARVGDAQCREPKAGGRNAGHGAPIVSVQERTIFDQPRAGIGFVPEESETPSLNFVEQLFIRAWIGGHSSLGALRGFGEREQRGKRSNSNPLTAPAEEFAVELSCLGWAGDPVSFSDLYLHRLAAS